MHCWLLENKFVYKSVVHCVYTKQLEGKMIVSLVWVDDIIVPASDMVLLSEIKEMLQGSFPMKDRVDCLISWVLNKVKNSKDEPEKILP